MRLDQLPPCVYVSCHDDVSSLVVSKWAQPTTVKTDLVQILLHNMSASGGAANFETVDGRTHHSWSNSSSSSFPVCACVARDVHYIIAVHLLYGQGYFIGN